jgi:hypothetical protein
MPLPLIAYGYVEPEPDAPPPRCGFQPVSDDVKAYLEAHVDALLTDAENDKISPAIFLSEESAMGFKALQHGSKEEFLDAARGFAHRLYKNMDNRAKRGFFVALRRTTDATTHAAILKLDVSDSKAAALKAVKDERTLEAVKDLLDLPGELQKGAITPDDRGGSQVIVGDKLTQTSLYFLKAIDVQQKSSPGPATASFLDAVTAKVDEDDKVANVALALEQEKRIEVEQFFTKHPKLLSHKERDDVLESLRDRTRPVDEIDPSSHAIRETVQADGITITGKASTLQNQMTIDEQPDGLWRIEIKVRDEPKLSYR